MAQTVAVVRGTLSATLNGTTDFTKSGFGTPTAAIVITCNANTTNNPQNDAQFSIGFWDGTNQVAVGVTDQDAQTTTQTHRRSTASGVLNWASSENKYTASSITDGIRLTLSVDNTGVQRYCTVLLFNGVTAKAGSLATNTTENGTAESASLGHAPSLIFFTTSGDSSATDSDSTSNLGFGFAKSNGTHRGIIFQSLSVQADATQTVLFSDTRCTGQVNNGAVVWTGEVTTFGSDTFTITTRDGSSDADYVFYLSLGGADLSFDCGTLTTPTSTGNNAVSTTIAPDAVLTFMSLATSTTIASDSQTNGLSAGMADDNGQFSHSQFHEDAAATTNTGSVASATALIDVDGSSGGARTDVLVGTVTLNASDFTINYTTVDASARKGWWVAFGTAAASTAVPRRQSTYGSVRFDTPQLNGVMFE